ncbi:MAG: YgjP-like metallopeptidase domain-containing protein, partial [Ignavibacteriaceae bacterium]
MNSKKSISHNSILINKEAIPYQIRFSRKAKYLQLKINHFDNLELVIPKGCSLNDGEKFLNEKSDWIKKHFNKIQLKEKNYFFLGKKIYVQIINDFFVKKPLIKFDGNFLKVLIPLNSDYKVDELYNAFLKISAKKYLILRTNYLANKSGVKFNKVGIRGQKTRWGSCSTKERLSFNYKLMKFRKEVIDYVIIHELCHLIEM